MFVDLDWQTLRLTNPRRAGLSTSAESLVLVLSIHWYWAIQDCETMWLYIFYLLIFIIAKQQYVSEEKITATTNDIIGHDPRVSKFGTSMQIGLSVWKMWAIKLGGRINIGRRTVYNENRIGSRLSGVGMRSASCRQWTSTVISWHDSLTRLHLHSTSSLRTSVSIAV